VKIDLPELFRPITRRGVWEGCRAGVERPVRVFLTEDYRGPFVQDGAPAPQVRGHRAACLATISATLPRPVFGGPRAGVPVRPAPATARAKGPQAGVAGRNGRCRLRRASRQNARHDAVGRVWPAGWHRWRGGADLPDPAG
jgi:hypothetical protein